MTADLIARIESADGPSYALDCAIGEYVAKATGRPYLIPPQPYTASIDAALTLVPDGWHMSANTTVGALLQGSAAVRDRDGGPSFTSAASTPALALAAAALKARGV